jgi:hypothetical protein
MGKTPFDAKELLAAGLDEMRRIIREQGPVGDLIDRSSIFGFIRLDRVDGAV